MKETGSLTGSKIKIGLSRITWLFIVIAGVFMICLRQSYAAETTSEKEIGIVFTHDLHSHFDSFFALNDTEVKEIGGFARIKTVIDEKKSENPNTLVLDAGDFSMGTLYQTIYAEEAPELKILGEMGYDVTTLGNHELDYRDDKFSQMLYSSLEGEYELPQFVLSNIDWEEANEDQLAVKQAMDAYGVRSYVMLNKGGLNIAVMGIFGKESYDYAPMTGLTFKDPIESARETVAQIKEQEDADMIICLSHSGISIIKDESEDEILAEKVPEIDVIISGHSHTTLAEPIIVGDTIIASTGEYGIYLGSMTLTEKEDGRFELADYELQLMDDNILQDASILEENSYFRSLIQESYLNQFNYAYDQVLTYNPYVFTSINELGKQQGEDTLGNILADSYIYAVNQAEGNDYAPVDVAVVPQGVVRDSFYQGEITVSDVYNVSSLGIGKDGIPGYPLLSVYLTGKELKTLAEVDASISPIMSEARLYMSGLHYTANPNRLILNRVTDVYLSNGSGERIEIEDNQLYRVAADLYSGQMLGVVTEKSYGILSIVPKDEDGNSIVNLEDHIIYYDGQELKAWVATAKYMESFADAGGNSQIPQYYEELHGRKVINDSKNIIELIKNPNGIAIILVLVFVVLLLIIISIVVTLVKKIRKRRT